VEKDEYLQVLSAYIHLNPGMYTEESLREIGLIMKMDYAAVSIMSRRFAEEIEMKNASSKLWKRLVACLAKRQLRKD